MRKFISFIRRLKEKVTNTIKWLPVIWNDHQWDFVFLLIVLRHKLILMEQFFRSDNAQTVDAEKRAEKIRTCILLLDRLINNDYYNIGGGHHLDKKWGELDFSIEGHKLSIRRELVRTELEQSKYEAEFSSVCAHEEELMLQDLNYLCKIINKHLFTWWD